MVGGGGAHNTPKGVAKALAVDLLRRNNLSGTKTAYVLLISIKSPPLPSGGFGFTFGSRSPVNGR